MDKSSEFNQLLRPELQDYIKEHESDDEKALVLKYKKVLGVSAADVAQQIAGRRKAKLKLPFLYNTRGIIYPPSINIEQCSSERAAIFKSNLVSGIRAIDLTGGAGIDSYFLSKHFNELIYVEKNEKLLQLSLHNHALLGAGNIKHVCMEAEDYINSADGVYDLIYLDPSRRKSDKKVFKFTDCGPNVVELLPRLLNFSDSILIKASPLIDIKQSIRELGNVSNVYVVGYNNECKEVLFLVNKIQKKQTIEVAELLIDGPSNKEPFRFTHEEETQAEVRYSEPKKYLYEPSALILKAGAFKLVAKKYGLEKIASNTHLYTSSEVVNSFPGKIFEIENYLKSTPKSIAELLPGRTANIVTRNYPLTPAQLKKKLKVNDGGEYFIVGFSGLHKKYLALAKRVK